MLGLTHYNPGRYPPPGFPAFSAGSEATPAFNRLQGMLDRKKGSNDILQQRAAQFQSAPTPASAPMLTQPSPTPVPTPMQARPAPSIASSYNIFTDAESGSDPAETEREQSEGEQDTFQPTVSGPSAGSALASAASTVGGTLASGAYKALSSSYHHAIIGSEILLDAGMHATLRAENALEQHARAVRQAVRHTLTQGVNTITHQLATRSASGTAFGPVRTNQRSNSTRQLDNMGSAASSYPTPLQPNFTRHESASSSSAAGQPTVTAHDPRELEHYSTRNVSAADSGELGHYNTQNVSAADSGELGHYNTRNRRRR